MDHDAPSPGIELNNVSHVDDTSHLPQTSQTLSTHQFSHHSLRPPSVIEGENDPSRPQSPLSTYEQALLQPQQHLSPRPSSDTRKEGEIDLRKDAADGKRWTFLLRCLPHMVPLAVTVTILVLNALGVYWQDVGRPHQNTILQALQYAAKAHEVTMVASLTAIVSHQIQHDLSGLKGIPLGFLTAGFQLDDPLFICSGKFWGGATARVHSKNPPRSFTLAILLITGLALTLAVGPSSAIAMIPRLDWRDVSRANAFGLEYNDRVFLNWTEAELWPANITNAIYANVSQCTSIATASEDCAVAAVNVVEQWIGLHQSQGTKPNITVFQESEVTRYLTSQGGPPDNSSWTASSTVGSLFTKDLDHYWDWLAENSSLPTNVDQPLLRPTFTNPDFNMRKPLVQAQCRTYLEPDYTNGDFELPHDELLTPPLDTFKDEMWSLPNEFVLALIGNDSLVGNLTDKSNPWLLFEWFDTASNFSTKGAPSLGAVVLYQAVTDDSPFVEALTTCSFDGRWVPVEFYLDPKDTITIYQDSPNPMEILKGSSKVDVKDLIQMKMSLEWANTMNIRSAPSPETEAVSTTLIEQMLQRFGSYNYIFPEPPPVLADGYVIKSLDWRFSTALGLLLAESLGHAFSDVSKGSMLYRQGPNVAQSYVRLLNDINYAGPKEGYKNGKLDWVETRDPRWNRSILPWDVWALENGYTEIGYSVQRNGYGYGFEGVPMKLAATVLALYVVLVCTYVMSVLASGRDYKGYMDMSKMVTLAWSSAPTDEVSGEKYTGEKGYRTWRRTVRVEEKEQRLQLVLEEKGDEGLTARQGYIKVGRD